MTRIVTDCLRTVTPGSVLWPFRPPGAVAELEATPAPYPSSGERPDPETRIQGTYRAPTPGLGFWEREVASWHAGHDGMTVRDGSIHELSPIPPRVGSFREPTVMHRHGVMERQWIGKELQDGCRTPQ